MLVADADLIGFHGRLLWAEGRCERYKERATGESAVRLPLLSCLLVGREILQSASFKICNQLNCREKQSTLVCYSISRTTFGGGSTGRRMTGSHEGQGDSIPILHHAFWRHQSPLFLRAHGATVGAGDS